MACNTSITWMCEEENYGAIELNFSVKLHDAKIRQGELTANQREKKGSTAEDDGEEISCMV